LVPEPLKITLGGADVSVNALTLGKIRRIKAVVKQGQEEKRQGLDVVDTAVEILVIVLEKSEDEMTGTAEEASAAAEAILRFAGFTVEPQAGEAPGAPEKTQRKHGARSTGA
jgi:hypothetical protein